MSWRNKLGESIQEAAAIVALAPAQLVMKLAPDNGPGGTAYAVLLMIPSAIITAPITVPMFMLGAAIKEDKDGHERRETDAEEHSDHQ